MNAPVPAQTSRAPPGPWARQFSVFLEDRCGKLLDLVRLVESAGVHILGLSLLDAADFAVARFITDDPDTVAHLLEAGCVSSSHAEVLVVEIADIAHGLGSLLAALRATEVNVYYSYSMLCRPNGRPLLAVCVEDNDLAADALRGNGLAVLRQADLSR